MAVVTVKSQAITDQDASPRVAPQAGSGAGYRVKEIDSFVTVTNGDSATSKFLFSRVPPSIRIKDLWAEWQALGSGCTVDVGVYYASRAEDCAVGIVPGTVIDADFFASAVDMAAAGAPTNITNESGTYTTALRDNPLWEALGLASDPGGKFDIVATIVVDAAATGRLYLKAGYNE